MTSLKAKLNPSTKEGIYILPVTQWTPSGGAPVTLNPGNEATYLGGLYNKDLDTDQYFKWQVSGSYPTSRLKDSTLESSFKKLIADFGNESASIYLDKLIPITSNYTIPENVEIIPQGGNAGFTISSGVTLTIDSYIETSKTQVFYGSGDVLLHGNMYVSPRAFGAVMNGNKPEGERINDRDAFVKTLKCSCASKITTLIERSIFIDVNVDMESPVFIDHDTLIDGAGKGSIVINNVLLPAFVIALSKNVRINNISILYDGEYEASDDGLIEGVTTAAIFLSGVLEAWLTANRGMTFTGSYSPHWDGPTAFRSIFNIRGSEDVKFKNVKFIALGETPNKFMAWLIKYTRERQANIVIDAGTSSLFTYSKNMTFDDIFVDGSIMGFQGDCDEITFNNIESKRYSDFQNEDGSFIGAYDGVSYNFPPPHLFYIGSNNISINNVVDHGTHVGVTTFRPTESGNCNSFKLNGNKISVNGYYCNRPDGLGDLSSNTNEVSMKNIYATYDSDTCPSSFLFYCLRFPSTGGAFENMTIENINIIDTNPAPVYFPIGSISNGNQCVFKNINVTLEDFTGTGWCGFSVWGNNNNVDYNIILKNHTATQTFVGSITIGSSYRSTLKNNKYSLNILGWRKIDSSVNNLRQRVILSNTNNPNQNEVVINDVNNDFVITQKGSLKTESWGRMSIISVLTSGVNNINTPINIPSGWELKSILFIVVTAVGASNGITSLSLGSSSGGTQYMSLLPLTGSVSKVFTTDVISGSNRSIYLSSVGGNFDGSGSVKIIFNIQRILAGE